MIVLISILLFILSIVGIIAGLLLIVAVLGDWWGKDGFR